jgi:CRISPR-associated protein Csb1
VTIRFARQTTVLSLPALRRLRFPLEHGGSRRTEDAIDSAARTTLAALALAAVSWQWKAGFDLRSRCLLIPEHELRVELLSTAPARVFSLSPEAATELLQHAAKAAVEAGLQWREKPLTLYPGKELTKVVQKSRQLAVEAEE